MSDAKQDRPVEGLVMERTAPKRVNLLDLRLEGADAITRVEESVRRTEAAATLRVRLETPRGILAKEKAVRALRSFLGGENPRARSL